MFVGEKPRRPILSVVNGINSEFLKQIKRMKGCNKNVAASIDGISGATSIANLFSNKFNALYNSFPSDKDDMSCLHDNVHQDINDKCKHMSASNVNHLHSVNVNDVINAVKTLKCGKSDGVVELCSDGIKHGTNQLYTLLSKIFTLFLTHGTCSDLFINGTMVPLPKIKGTNNSDEFRAITLSSVIGKVFDIILLNHFESELQTSNLQFGFKSGSSTSACTFAVQEVLSHYRNKYHCILYTVGCLQGF